MFCFPNTGPVINTLKSCFFQISSYSKGQVPLGPSLRKQNIQAKEVYRELKQRGRRGRQQERQKTNRFRLVKQQLCTCITPFCTFLSLRCTTGTWILDFTRPLYGGRWTQKKNFFFLLLNLDTVLSDSTPEDFLNIRQIEVLWSLKQCEFTLCLRFVCPEICYHGNLK